MESFAKMTSTNKASKLSSFLPSAVLAFRGLSAEERLEALGALIRECDGKELFHWQNILTDRYIRLFNLNFVPTLRSVPFTD